MCLKTQAPWAMPAETERSVSADRRSTVGGVERGRVFVDLYAAEGKPGLSPIILAFVSVFQFMENLADRQAVEALRMRLDWKYALHVPLDWLRRAGLNFSVLREFRDRQRKGRGTCV